MARSITRMIHDWRDGDDDAAVALDRQMRANLLALVRRGRDPRLQARIDSEGIVNDALKSFLCGVRRGEFKHLRDRNDAKRLLTTFVVRELRDEVRRNLADKRDARRESQEVVDMQNSTALSSFSPEESVAAVEYFENFQVVVRDAHENAIDVLELRLEGLPNAQIAIELGLGVRTVQVIIQRMIDRWLTWLEAQNDNSESVQPKQH